MARIQSGHVQSSTIEGRFIAKFHKLIFRFILWNFTYNAILRIVFSTDLSVV